MILILGSNPKTYTKYMILMAKLNSKTIGKIRQSIDKSIYQHDINEQLGN